MRSWLLLAVFIIAVIGTGSLLGIVTAPGPWYAALEKPWFTPPNWLFGPVWTVLYLLIAIVGWRVWNRPGLPTLKGLWVVQMALNFLWSPVFFGAQAIGLGAIVILALLAAILAFIGKAWTRDPVSATLFVPYAAWVGYASALNIAIFLLN
ncbi:TspO/MBR family protein [Pelagibacterium limicola]|uniref:TspO/MBR family protein n=1 Tax=Pelagibacterium limicola TaxID=2791022 RepID=UPI0018AF5E86|nr:TspO/MBR family protein [Pelagibacterium limicola]